MFPENHCQEENSLDKAPLCYPATLADRGRSPQYIQNKLPINASTWGSYDEPKSAHKKALFTR